jgi:hypothetical protein
VAVLQESLGLVQALLSAGASPDRPGLLSLEPVVLAAIGSGATDQVLLALISAGAAVNAEPLTGKPCSPWRSVTSTPRWRVR